jgi:hypothetical protein
MDRTRKLNASRTTKKAMRAASPRESQAPRGCGNNGELIDPKERVYQLKEWVYKLAGV